MNARDIIELPGYPGMFGRRALVEAWVEAGSPPVNNGGAGRLYALQKYFYDGWRAGKPGFNPADNPDDETQRLAHVRFVALDIDPTPTRVKRLRAAGLIRPYSYEPWHWELPNVRSYAIVRSLPAVGGVTIPGKEDSMFIAIVKKKDWYLVTGGKACLLGSGSGARESGAPILNFVDDWAVKQLKAVVSGIK